MTTFNPLFWGFLFARNGDFAVVWALWRSFSFNPLFWGFLFARFFFFWLTESKFFIYDSFQSSFLRISFCELLLVLSLRFWAVLGLPFNPLFWGFLFARNYVPEICMKLGYDIFQSSFLRISFCEHTIDKFKWTFTVNIHDFQSSFLRISFCEDTVRLKDYVELSFLCLSILFFEDFFLRGKTIELEFRVYTWWKLSILFFEDFFLRAAAKSTKWLLAVLTFNSLFWGFLFASRCRQSIKRTDFYCYHALSILFFEDFFLRGWN